MPASKLSYTYVKRVKQLWVLCHLILFIFYSGIEEPDLILSNVQLELKNKPSESTPVKTSEEGMIFSTEALLKKGNIPSPYINMGK